MIISYSHKNYITFIVITLLQVLSLAENTLNFPQTYTPNKYVDDRLKSISNLGVTRYYFDRFGIVVDKQNKADRSVTGWTRPKPTTVSTTTSIQPTINSQSTIQTTEVTNSDDDRETETEAYTTQTSKRSTAPSTTTKTTTSTETTTSITSTTITPNAVTNSTNITIKTTTTNPQPKEEDGVSTALIIVIVIGCIIIFNCLAWLAYVIYSNNYPVLEILDRKGKRSFVIKKISSKRKIVSKSSSPKRGKRSPRKSRSKSPPESRQKN